VAQISPPAGQFKKALSPITIEPAISVMLPKSILAKDVQFQKALPLIVLRIVTVEVPNTTSFKFRSAWKAPEPIEPSWPVAISLQLVILVIDGQP
jgi:hypothetical protein